MADDKTVEAVAAKRYPALNANEEELTYPREAIRHFQRGAFIEGYHAAIEAHEAAKGEQFGQVRYDDGEWSREMTAPDPGESDREALADLVCRLMHTNGGTCLGGDRHRHLIVADHLMREGFRRHPAPAPVVVETVEALGEAQSDSDWGYLMVMDAAHRPWIVYDTAEGDFLAISFPYEDDEAEAAGEGAGTAVPLVDAREIAFPATVLTPATTATVSAADAWDEGWHEHFKEWARQSRDPWHPITKNNPYRADALRAAGLTVEDGAL